MLLYESLSRKKVLQLSIAKIWTKIPHAVLKHKSIATLTTIPGKSIAVTVSSAIYILKLEVSVHLCAPQSERALTLYT